MYNMIRALCEEICTFTKFRLLISSNQNETKNSKREKFKSRSRQHGHPAKDNKAAVARHVFPSQLPHHSARQDAFNDIAQGNLFRKASHPSQPTLPDPLPLYCVCALRERPTNKLSTPMRKAKNRAFNRGWLVASKFSSQRSQSSARQAVCDHKHSENSISPGAHSDP